MGSRTAACSCGQLRIEVHGEPLGIGVCHCLAYQRRTGSVFAALARFAAPYMRSSARRPTTFASVTTAPNSGSGSALAAGRPCFTPKRGANNLPSRSPSAPSPTQVFRPLKIPFMTVADTPGFGSHRGREPTTRTLVHPRPHPGASPPDHLQINRQVAERVLASWRDLAFARLRPRWVGGDRGARRRRI
jgi:hypothetical protein